MYCACTTFMEMLRRLAHDHRDPTAFSPRSRSDRRTLAFALSMLKTNAVTRRSLATVATTARCLAFLPRLYHVSTTLMATLARSGPIFRRRRHAVRTPPRCDGGITKHSNAFRTFLNWLKNSKRVWHEPKLHIMRVPLFANFDL